MSTQAKIAKPRAYCCTFRSSTEKGSICLHVTIANLTASINLTQAEAHALADRLRKDADSLPRVASGADLGLEAA